jgi:hypothetical protein
MVSDLLEAVTSLKALLLVLLIFGFAPSAVIRLISLVFHADDPRRQEMRAELHAVPRLERPVWVAQQLEVVLFEGVPDRVIDLLAGRLIYRWHLGNGVESNRLSPETFWIPPAEEKARVKQGTVVKLMFHTKAFPGERMWVQVSEVTSTGLVGTLANDPVFTPRLSYGDKIKFDVDHIIDIDLDTVVPTNKVIDGAQEAVNDG